jgi:hypothetical protein
MRDMGFSLIVITTIFMALPLLALFDDPIEAVKGAEWFYVFFVFLPLAIGSLLIALGFRRKRHRRNSTE